MNRAVPSVRTSEMVTSSGGLRRATCLHPPPGLWGSLFSHFVDWKKKFSRKERAEDQKRGDWSARVSPTLAHHSTPLYTISSALFPIFVLHPESGRWRSRVSNWCFSRGGGLHLAFYLQLWKLSAWSWKWEYMLWAMIPFRHCLELSEKAAIFLQFEEFLTFVCEDDSLFPVQEMLWYTI